MDDGGDGGRGQAEHAALQAGGVGGGRGGRGGGARAPLHDPWRRAGPAARHGPGPRREGHRAVTFDMRGAGRSTGRASLTGSSEVGDVVAVCRWVADTLKPRAVLLVGSSAGRLTPTIPSILSVRVRFALL